MRPYLAIIVDSFRAARSSRVLYVLLLLITLLLLALAPLHIRETLDWQLSREANVRFPERLLRRIAENHSEVNEKPIARIWDQLPESLRKKITKSLNPGEEKEAKEETGKRRRGGPPEGIEDMLLQERLIEELNELIKDRDFYRAEDWEGRAIPLEAEELIEMGPETLSDVRSRRLNRLLIATAVSPTIDAGKKSALQVAYAIWDFPAPISMTHQQFAQALTSSLPWYFEKLVLSIGLLIAIIITANMIPDTFEPGSLNLLLSKPISRWGLLSAKFFGGCVFIALCAAYLFIGLWLWLGLGMGVWDRAILFSIPLYVIVFAIYFSVSALVGIIWRSPIVSVILTLLFWAFCFSIGTVYSRFDTKMQNSELVQVLPTKDEVFSCDLVHQLHQWKDKQWERRAEAALGEQGEMQFAINSFILSFRDIPAMPGINNFLPAVYDSRNDKVLTSRYELGRSMSSGKKPLLISNEDNSSFIEVGKLPSDTVEMFDTKLGIIAATSNGSFHLLDSEVVKNPKPAKSTAKMPMAKQAGSEKDTASKTDEETPSEATTPEETPAEDAKVVSSESPKELFRRIGPDSSFSARSSNYIDYNIARDEFAVYRRGELKIYHAEGESYNLRATLDLDIQFEASMTARLAYQGDIVFLSFGNGKVITVDAETVTEKNDYHPESRSAVEQVAGSPTGKYFSVLYRNGNVWALDMEDESRMSKAKINCQGQVCTMAFGPGDEFWVGEDSDRASQFDLATGKQVERLAPKGDFIKNAYRMAIRPFYRVCPKPGEFYKVVAHLSSSGDAEANNNIDMNKTLEAADPWSPLWSGLVFMFGMLFLACVVFHFKDF